MLKFEDDPFTGELKRPNMTCDNPLTRKTIKIFPNCSHAMLFSGKPGSGKSTTAYSLLEPQTPRANNVYNRVFRRILWAAPQASRASVKGVMEDIPDADVYDTLSPALFDRVEEEAAILRDSKKGGGGMLLIIDDLSAVLKDWQRDLEHLIYNRRHLRLSVWILTQYPMDCPRSVRVNLSHAVLFAPNSKPGAQIIQEEFTDWSTPQFRDMARKIWKNPHDFLLVDRNRSEYFRNYQRIVL